MSHDDPVEFVRQVRAGRSAYHHHKEQMAFGAAGLYVAGTTALLVVDAPFWNGKPLETLIVVIAGISLTALFHDFVQWQLDRRRDASTMVRACDILLARWMEKDAVLPASETERKLTPFENELWPAFLVAELDRAKKDRAFNWSIDLSDQRVINVMGIWGVLALLRITYPLIIASI